MGHPVSTTAKTPNVVTASTSWGKMVPDWIIALAEECDCSSQGKVALRLGVSSTVINQALHNSYPGRLDRVEERVRGEFMRAVVDCPVLGEISARKCLDERQRPFSSSNSLRLQLYRACKSCPNNGRKP